MPDLNQLPVPQYDPGQPYHWAHDNLPLKTLAERDEIINFEVDNHGNILRSCAGTQGTLSNRLAQSIDQDGNLLSTAVDQSLHNIAEHSDGSKSVTTPELEEYQELGFSSLVNPVSFVRMLTAERDKLAMIADEATNVTVSVQTNSNTVDFESGQLKFVPSDSVEWQIESPNKVKAVLRVSTDFAHRHFYEQTPIETLSDDAIPVPYKKYYITSVSNATPIVKDSLRVYVNGARLNSSYAVPYPDQMATVWNTNMFTASYVDNSFVLNSPIAETDVILIDFDISLT
jgi:hypothetical protein